MTMSIQEISDRLEITDTINRYSHGLDQRLWDQWDLAFAPDAVIDFSHVGLREFSVPEAIEFFSPAETKRITGQHLLTNTLITLAGDTATARSEFILNTAAWVDAPGGQAVLNHGGGWYDDELRRTDAGWRITRRTAYTKWISQETIDWNLPGQ